MDADLKTFELAQDAPRRSMQRLVREFVDARLADCMEVMAEYPDGHFDIAIVDPPYGIGMSRQIGKRKGERGCKWGGKKWDESPPSPEYFAELRRVSKHQIVWGGNYFPLPPSRCFVVWDKVQRIDQADCELAWTSFDTSARIYTYARSNLQGFRNPHRFHPTEKPVDLYKWLLANYAKPGDRILDTHMGSGSIGIACHYYRCPLVACEIDPDYFRAACDRIERETAQVDFYLPNDQV